MEFDATIPLGYDIAYTVIVALWAILTGAALVSVFRTHHDRSGSKFWWSALVIALPVLGASAWFLSSDRRRDTKRDHA
jgi:hypothetical protein